MGDAYLGYCLPTPVYLFKSTLKAKKLVRNHRRVFSKVWSLLPFYFEAYNGCNILVHFKFLLTMSSKLHILTRPISSYYDRLSCSDYKPSTGIVYALFRIYGSQRRFSRSRNLVRTTKPGLPASLLHLVLVFGDSSHQRQPFSSHGKEFWARSNVDCLVLKQKQNCKRWNRWAPCEM